MESKDNKDSLQETSIDLSSTEIANQKETNHALSQIPSEILVIICEFLNPKDLFSLTLVCKKLRRLLWSFSSYITQQIWRNARIKLSILDEYKGIPPPEGIMFEQQYIWLIHLADACQFCGNKRRGASKIYWPFKMYCCVPCINLRTLNNETAKQRGISYTVFDILPHIVLYRDNLKGSKCDNKLDRYCLRSEAIGIQKEYESIVDFEEKLKWVEKKKQHQLVINDKLVQYTLREENRIQRIWREEYKLRFGYGHANR
ncbi:13191_t:CDS:2 [Funneliformis mosseae]|uniref:13191_t:CDS:1 n=1 Tax=Funneliformis mosseae TaxID=27381 RepID=A0A9N9EHJ9_FUNMO|nr:13191_t:CDS:2 [Funneliformis mosseae]